MSFPIDQFVGLTKANGQFALKLAEIARSSAEEYLRIGAKTAASLVDQTRSASPAAASASVLGDIEQSREAAIAKTKSAVEDWQGAWKDAWSTASIPNGPTALFESALQPWLSAIGAATSPRQETPAPSAKPQD